MNSKADYFQIRDQANRLKHQYYFLDMPLAPSSALVDIFEFEGTRAIGEPSRIRIRFTHPSRELSRSEYVGKTAAFVVRTDTAHRIHGVVTSFAWLGSSQDESIYEIVLESRLALLRNTPKVRFFYDMSFIDVMTQVLDENGFDGLQASFDFLKLYRAYEQRPIVTQWEEDDLTFLQRLCRRSGIWFVCEARDDHEVIVFGDDLTHYVRGDSLRMAYRPPSGMNDEGVETVESLTMHATSIAQSYSVRSYHPDNGYEPIDASAAIRDDETTYGDAYTYGLPYQTKQDAEHEVQLRQRIALAHQIRYEGVTNKVEIGPRYVVKLTNRVLADADDGLLVVSMKMSASRKARYKVEFTAIPSDRFYHMPLMEETWPRITGTITGNIASPNDYPHPFITRQGQYVVQLHSDRDARRPGANSCPMRLAKPYAGKHYTGMHFGLVDGTLVAVAFHHGNPDLPYIAHALHSSVHPDPINSEDRWLSRDTIHFRSNNTIESENWEGEEHLKLSTDHGKSQLNLGHTVGRGHRYRGEGFELRSDMRGAVRAGDGLLLSAEKQSQASGDVVDMTGAKQVFQFTQEQAESLMQAVSVAKAEAVDLKAERQWLKDELAELKKSVIALSAPNGIGMATPDRVSIAAGKDVNVATTGGFNVSAMKNVAMAAKEKVSLFAYKLGIGIRAAQGPVEIQAQSDVMSLAAQKDVTVSSVDGAVRVRAKQDVMIESGGAFIEIKDGNITLGGPGKLTFKFASMSKQGAEMAHLSAPAFASTAVSFKTRCDAWLSGNTTMAKVSPPSQAVDWTQFENRTFAPAPPILPDEAMPAVLDADQNSKREPRNAVTPEGETPELIKLGSPVPCNWVLEPGEKTIAGWSETGLCEMLDEDGAPVLQSEGKPLIGGGTFGYAFTLKYDPKAKCVTASINVDVVPVDIVVTDSSGVPILKDGVDQSIPYEMSRHGQLVEAGPGKAVNGLTMRYRDDTNLDLVALKSAVEATLNRHGGVLILDGCTRGSSCGQRVQVKMEINLTKRIRDLPGGATTRPVALLFPKAERASQGAWGERVLGLKSGLVQYIDALESNVLTHECMHLFGAPDEYWYWGGFVHRQYIKDGKLDFAKKNELSGKLTWQMLSRVNLMGKGANESRAEIRPYYLEYVRRGFEELNGKRWKIGFEGDAVND